MSDFKNPVFSYCRVKNALSTIFNFFHFHHGIITNFILYYNSLVLWTHFLKKRSKQVLSMHLQSCGLWQIHKEASQLITFLLKTLFLRHASFVESWMSRKSNSFVYMFDTNCQFFQITLSEYALQSWKLACITLTIRFSCPT